MRITVSRSLLLLIAGSILAVLSATGAFALAQDTARSSDNYFVTKRSVHDIKVALGIDATCPAANTFVDNAPAVIEVDDAYYDPDQIWVEIAEVEVCVRNDGDDTTLVKLGFENVINEEVTCAPGEAEQDATCAPGLAGEVQQYTVVKVTLVSCTGAGLSPGVVINIAAFITLTSPDALGPFPAGATCLWRLNFYEDVDNSDEVAAVQTDRLEFDIVFFGVDPI
jgi:hypothetical protein